MTPKMSEKWALVCIFLAPYFLLIAGQNLPSMGQFQCTSSACDSVTCQPINNCSGILMNSPSFECSCCQTCIQYIAENSSCIKSSSERMCGPGLTCKSVGQESKCEKIVSECTTKQKEHDEQNQNALVGMFVSRPNCDENGDYSGRKCQPGSSCYCVDKQGKRIFGEAPPSQATNDLDMNCECARDEIAVKQMGSTLIEFPHCLPNGNYDSLQCIGQACFCMGIDKKPITSLVPITAIESLPCYNTNIHYSTYYRPCERENQATRNMIKDYALQNITLLGLETQSCTPDGFYSPVRKEGERLYCADPYGNQIESYETTVNSDEASDMNCRCARTRYWLTEEPVAKPSCCRNGNYKLIQCRRGYCFCVDPETGDQDPGQYPTNMEVSASNINLLHCYEKYINNPC